MTMEINQRLRDIINDQVTNEYQASLLYTQLGFELERLSFDGMASWMQAQAAEEREHAEKFADHLLARNSRVDLGTIEIPTVKIDSPLEAFKMSLAHEEKVSGQIREIARVADEVNDYDSRSLINWFLDEQIEEEDTVSGIIDQVELVGDDGSGLLRIDHKLASRDGES